MPVFGLLKRGGKVYKKDNINGRGVPVSSTGQAQEALIECDGDNNKCKIIDINANY